MTSPFHGKSDLKTERVGFWLSRDEQHQPEPQPKRTEHDDGRKPLPSTRGPLELLAPLELIKGFHHALSFFGSVFVSLVFGLRTRTRSSTDTPRIWAIESSLSSVTFASPFSMRYQYCRPTPNCLAASITDNPRISCRNRTLTAMFSRMPAVSVIMLPLTLRL